MGECNYYVKARFASSEAAKAAIQPLLELLEQGDSAYNYWQKSRSNPRNRVRQQPPAAGEFWATFRNEYPLIIGFLGDFADSLDWDNGLAGHLSCMADCQTQIRSLGTCITQEHDEIRLKLASIWHCADLSMLEAYFIDKLGAIAAGSISEEDLEMDEDDEDEVFEDGFYFDAIDLSRQQDLT